MPSFDFGISDDEDISHLNVNEDLLDKDGEIDTNDDEDISHLIFEDSSDKDGKFDTDDNNDDEDVQSIVKFKHNFDLNKVPDEDVFDLNEFPDEGLDQSRA